MAGPQRMKCKWEAGCCANVLLTKPWRKCHKGPETECYTECHTNAIPLVAFTFLKKIGAQCHTECHTLRMPYTWECHTNAPHKLRECHTYGILRYGILSVWHCVCGVEPNVFFRKVNAMRGIAFVWHSWRIGFSVYSSQLRRGHVSEIGIVSYAGHLAN